MITPNVITDAANEPITLAEAKAFLRITHSDDEAVINMFISAARREYEWLMGRTIHQQTLEMYFEDGFPSGPMLLPRATPLISVTHIKYKDSDGTEHTWSSAEYVLDTAGELGSIQPAYGYSYPAFTPYPVNPVWIQYVCGIATTSPITQAPDDIKAEICRMVARQYENRELSRSSWDQRLASFEI